MIAPLDRSGRDSTRSQFTTRQLRDFIDPNHLLIRIDERLDFAKLVAPMEGLLLSVRRLSQRTRLWKTTAASLHSNIRAC